MNEADGFTVVDDRWKIDGDCTKCRRQKYCKTVCKMHNDAIVRQLEEKLYERIFKAKAIVDKASKEELYR